MDNNSRGQAESKARKSKIQSLIIRHLKEQGFLNILLPDGIVLEIGTIQVEKDNKRVKSNDYCSVTASRDKKRTLLDSYSMGLSFQQEEKTMIFEDYTYDLNGETIRSVDVI